MDELVQFWTQQWHAYPEPLVVSSVVIVAVLLLWLVLKFAAWLAKWLLICAALVVFFGAAWYLVSGS
jgi:hypothetical protein